MTQLARRQLRISRELLRITSIAAALAVAGFAWRIARPALETRAAKTCLTSVTNRKLVHEFVRARLLTPPPWVHSLRNAWRSTEISYDANGAIVSVGDMPDELISLRRAVAGDDWQFPGRLAAAFAHAPTVYAVSDSRLVPRGLISAAFPLDPSRAGDFDGDGNVEVLSSDLFGMDMGQRYWICVIAVVRIKADKLQLAGLLIERASMSITASGFPGLTFASGDAEYTNWLGSPTASNPSIALQPRARLRWSSPGGILVPVWINPGADVAIWKPLNRIPLEFDPSRSINSVVISVLEPLAIELEEYSANPHPPDVPLITPLGQPTP